MFDNYTTIGLLKLILEKIFTLIFYPRCRLIRLPFYVRGKSKIFFGSNLTTGVGCRFDVFSKTKDKKLIIGDGVQINDYVHLAVVESLVIGNRVLIASRVFISDHNHGSYTGDDSPLTPPVKRQIYSQPVVIEDDVWIGESVCILPGVKIGKGAVIGAGAVVTHDVESYTVAVGSPARSIKKYDFTLKHWITIK